MLAAFDRRRITSQEAGLKYFLLGSFSSAVFLYGVALVYGGTGTTNLTGIADFLATTTLLHDGVLLLGIAFLLVGLGLQGRGRAVPHVDARRVPGRAHAGHRVHGRGDQGRRVRRGAAGASSASFALYSVDWRPIVWALAVLSLLVGSIAAVVQTDVKRMLAYSSITHAGFVLIAVQAATAKGTSAALFYVLVVRGDDDRRVRGCRRWSPARATTSTRSPTTAGSRAASRCSPGCSRCSCSRRPACRSPAASSPSSRCSAPRSTSGSTGSR